MDSTLHSSEPENCPENTMCVDSDITILNNTIDIDFEIFSTTDLTDYNSEEFLERYSINEEHPMIIVTTSSPSVINNTYIEPQAIDIRTLSSTVIVPNPLVTRSIPVITSVSAILLNNSNIESHAMDISTSPSTIIVPNPLVTISTPVIAVSSPSVLSNMHVLHTVDNRTLSSTIPVIPVAQTSVTNTMPVIPVAQTSVTNTIPVISVAQTSVTNTIPVISVAQPTVTNAIPVKTASNLSLTSTLYTRPRATDTNTLSSTTSVSSTMHAVPSETHVTVQPNSQIVENTSRTQHTRENDLINDDRTPFEYSMQTTLEELDKYPLTEILDTDLQMTLSNTSVPYDTSPIDLTLDEQDTTSNTTSPLDMQTIDLTINDEQDTTSNTTSSLDMPIIDLTINDEQDTEEKKLRDLINSFINVIE